MDNNGALQTKRRLSIRHRGRLGQVRIYGGKMLRMFIYQNDWKVLPMAVLIAGLVGLVIRKRLFITMEGSLMGGFAMVMVCIWNGCFNSVQVICRERDVIKREHRSGMHISSYILSHMMYQALLCLLQTGVTVYVTRMVGVQYPKEGLFTPWFLVDFGISLFLIAYASDMMSLWVSALSRNTTTAMTIMPFVLIFQLVFSGGMLNLPAWTSFITPYTISNPGMKVVAAQANYNSRPIMTLWDQVEKTKDREVEAIITVGDVINLLHNEKFTSQTATITAKGDLLPVTNPLGGILSFLFSTEESTEEMDLQEIIDNIAADPSMQDHMEDGYIIHSTVGDLVEFFGRDKVADILQNKVSETNYNEDYAYTKENILSYWERLLLFVLAFGVLSTITLEFIDKDKR